MSRHYLTFLPEKPIVQETIPMEFSHTSKLILTEIKQTLLRRKHSEKITKRILGAETYEQLLWGILGDETLEDECRTLEVRLTREYEKIRATWKPPERTCKK